MSKQPTTLRVEQVFSNNEHKTLERVVIYDNDIAYDVHLGSRLPKKVGVMGRNTDGVFYEIASKKAGELCENHYHLANYRATIFLDNHHATNYANTQTERTHESLTALVYNEDGTVRGGLVFPGSEQGFNIFYDQERWASFLWTPEGVKYIQKEDMETMHNKKMLAKQDPDKERWPVEIDGKTMHPVTMVDVPASEWRSGNGFTEEKLPNTTEDIFIKKMQILGELSKLSLPAQHRVLNQCARLIRLNMRERGDKV